MVAPDASSPPPGDEPAPAAGATAAPARAPARSRRCVAAVRRGLQELSKGIPPKPFDVALGTAIGAVVAAMGNALAILVTVPWPEGGLAVRVAHHGFDALQTTGLASGWGLVVAGLCFATRRRWPIGWLLACLPAIGGMWFALGVHLERQADCVLGGRIAWLLLPTYVVLCGLAVPVAHLLGSALSRTPATAAVSVGLGLAGNAVAHGILRDDYPGVHAAILWVAVVLLGATLAPHLRPGLTAHRQRVAVPFAMGLCLVVALLWAPPNRIRLQLFREPGAVAAWVLARTLWARPQLSSAPAGDAPVYQPPDRAAAPRLGSRLAEHPVVVLVTVEALRADVLASGRYDADLPNLVWLRDHGAYFPRAIGPGSQTSVVLTSMFTGRYFSQLRWAKHGDGNMRFLYAAGDDAVRFPELLTRAGIETQSFLGLIFLGDYFGVARGFERETMVVRDRRHAMAAELMRPLEACLRRKRQGGLFAYVHLMEPHAPYDRGALKEGSEWERYISEVAEVDRWIGRLIKLMRRQYRRRGYLIVTGDHGEAFGEHGTWKHSKTLYDELVRVPLVLWGHGIETRHHSEPAGMIDIGATVLQLFRLPPSPDHMGASLLPLATGRAAPLQRPLVAEGRLRQALFERDGLKVIEDTRRKTVEVYDLVSDPGETRNLFDAPTPRVEAAVARLRAFFDHHTLRADGYRPPYKR
jgi:hypothetical protein